MTWPMSQDYNESIQNPPHCFADPELQRGEAVTSELGLPIPYSGNFADVYAVAAGPHKWAVKCFTREIPGLKERYAAISQFLRNSQLPFMVDFRFLEQGIRVRNGWYPILKMQWVEGQALNTFVRENAAKPQVLDALCQIWHRLAVRLREANIAHCDMQHGNILMVQGAAAGRLGVRLVDYDGMCVPALEFLKSVEVGHPSYQHPQRLRERVYGMDVDRFSNLVIYTALRALKVEGKALWDRYDNGDNLLFRQADFTDPPASPLFQELLKSSDPDVTKLARALATASQQTMDGVPPLEQLIGMPKTVVDPLRPVPVQKPSRGSAPGTTPSAAVRSGKGSWPGNTKPQPDAQPLPQAIPLPQPDAVAARKKRAVLLGIGAGFFVMVAAALGGMMILGGGKAKTSAQGKARKELAWSSPHAKVVESKSALASKKLAASPALIVQCGKGKGNDQMFLRSPGYDCKLTQGANFDGWPGDAIKTHCWVHEKKVCFEVVVPPGSEGVLRLVLVDGDNLGRKERVFVQDRRLGDYADFGSRGREVTAPISGDDAKSGKINVSVVTLGPASAVVSTVVFTPEGAQPRR